MRGGSQLPSEANHDVAEPMNMTLWEANPSVPTQKRSFRAPHPLFNFGHRFRAVSYQVGSPP